MSKTEIHCSREGCGQTLIPGTSLTDSMAWWGWRWVPEGYECPLHKADS